MEKRLFTSECVTNGHPDKVADSISDAILDACLAQDPGSRVACETMVTTNFCLTPGSEPCIGHHHHPKGTEPLRTARASLLLPQRQGMGIIRTQAVRHLRPPDGYRPRFRSQTLPETISTAALN